MRLKALPAGFTRSADYPFILTVNLLPEKEEADFFTKKNCRNKIRQHKSDEDGLHYSAVLDDCILVDDDDAVMN